MAAPMDLPCALVASCGAVNPNEVIKQILDTDELPPEQQVTDCIVGYPWSIENKYYTAKLQLCSTPSKTIGDAEFAERLEAIIIICDDKASSFESVKQWMPFVNQLSPSTQLLACQQFTTNGDVSRHTAQLWCIDNSFELVELERAEDDDDEDDDEYDITGVKRIISALHAHSWSNLDLKENRGIFSLLQSEMLNAKRQHSNEESSSNADVTNPSTETDTHTDPRTGTLTDPRREIVTPPSPVSDASTPTPNRLSGEAAGALEETTQSVNNQTAAEATPGTEGAQVDGKDTTFSGKETASSQDRIDNLLHDDMQIFRTLGNEDPGEESFEELFSKMAAMKDRASGLSGDNRKKYAEKVAVAFWRALGGDEEEVDGLEDSD